MKPILTLAAISLLPCLAHAGSAVTYTYNGGPYVINAPVTDNSGIGLSSTKQVTTLISSISNVDVSIAMSGGWSGDLYAYLTHGTGFAVLLNRPGRTLGDLAGSGADDLAVTFSTTALADIHTGIPNTGTAAGLFQPDGREADPDNALDSSPRTAFLSSFEGLDPNGDWTLYVADVASGDTMTLQSWSLTITGVPEPSAALLAALGTLGLLRRKREQA